MAIWYGIQDAVWIMNYTIQINRIYYKISSLHSKLFAPYLNTPYMHHTCTVQYGSCTVYFGADVIFSKGFSFFLSWKHCFTHHFFEISFFPALFQKFLATITWLFLDGWFHCSFWNNLGHESTIPCMHHAPYNTEKLFPKGNTYTIYALYNADKLYGANCLLWNHNAYHYQHVSTRNSLQI